jgi:hypothetical protein
MVRGIDESGGVGPSVIKKLLWCALALSLFVTPLHAAKQRGDGKPAIDGLSARLENDHALISFRLTGAIDEEREELIHSGIPVIFRHRLEVRSKRTFTGIPMPPKLLARTLVETRVEYDSLTRRYELMRRIEHRTRNKKDRPPTEEQRLITESMEEMRAWMNELSEISIFDPSRPLSGEKLRVNVEVSLGRRYVLLIFPATISTSAEIPLGP